MAVKPTRLQSPIVTLLRISAQERKDSTSLVEGVGPGSPPGEEHGQAHRLEQLGGDTDTDGIEGALLGEGLGEELQRGTRQYVINRQSTVDHGATPTAQCKHREQTCAHKSRSAGAD